LARETEKLGEFRRRYETLSRRQKEVMWLVASGCANKEIAARLEISIRTVETYRAWVLERMHARTLAELVKIAHQLELAGVCTGHSCSGGSAAIRPNRD
jgi:two-component system response regulator FixJ